MIAPNMATMLAFIFTNLDFKRDECKEKLERLLIKLLTQLL